MHSLDILWPMHVYLGPGQLFSQQFQSKKHLKKISL